MRAHPRHSERPRKALGFQDCDPVAVDNNSFYGDTFLLLNDYTVQRAELWALHINLLYSTVSLIFSQFPICHSAQRAPRLTGGLLT